MRLPYPFSLSGSAQAKLWRDVTNNEWQNLLPPHWKDKGFHFYRRVRQRGPDAGINTPADLELEINKGTVSPDQGLSFAISLSIVDSSGKHMKIFYELRSKQCELVTMTFK
jgi:hypothetical protein